MRMNFRRPNPVYSEDYRALLDVVTTARRTSGLTQRQLAELLGKAHSHVSRIELGQRRVDTLELYFIALALGLEPQALFSQVVQRLDSLRCCPA